MAWLRTISIKLRLTILLLALLSAMLAIGLSQKQSADNINEMLNSMFLNQLVPVSEAANANMQAIYHIRDLYKFVIEADATAMASIFVDMQKYEVELTKQLDQYRKSVLDPEEERLLGDFAQQWQSYKQSSEKVIASSREGNNDLAMQIMRAETAPAFEKADAILSELVELNIKLSEKAYKDSDVLVAKLTKQFVFVMVIVLMIAAIGGIFIVRSIIAPLTQTIDDLGKLAKGDLQPSAPPSGQDELTNLQQSMHSTRTALRDTVQVILSISENLSTSAASLSAAGHQVMTSSGMQAQAIANSAASIEEMSVSISQLSDSANGANEQALKAGSLARQGEQQVENVAVEIKTLTNAINQSAAQIRQLAEDVAKISQITVLIKGVADQTNLLALNAAIEAARAGDMGRGFAVVADEVRQLAERTSKATQEIDGMISGVQTAASSTVSNMDKYIQSIENVRINTGKANEIIGEIDQSSEQVVQLMDEVNVMLKEQSSASQLIAQSVEEVNNMSQENVAASESVNGEALRITQIVNELKQSVAVFKLR